MADALLDRHRILVRHVPSAAVDHRELDVPWRTAERRSPPSPPPISSAVRASGRWPTGPQPLPRARHRNSCPVRPGQPRHGTGRLVRRAPGRPAPWWGGPLRRHPLGLRPGQQAAAPPAKGPCGWPWRPEGRPAAPISGAPAVTPMRTRSAGAACSWSWRSRSALILLWGANASPGRGRRNIRTAARARREGHAATTLAATTRDGRSIRLRLRAVSVTTLWALAVYGIYSTSAPTPTNIAHMTSGLLAAALACFGLGAIVGNLAGGRLTDRWGGRTVSIVSLSALAALNRCAASRSTPGRRAPARPARVALAAYPTSPPKGPAHRLPASGQRVADCLEQQCDVRGHPHRVSPRRQGPDSPGRAASLSRPPPSPPSPPWPPPATPPTAPHRVERRNEIRSGYRAIHADGHIFAGIFTPPRRPAAYPRAADFAGEPATARFSSSSCRR